jgi:hypothetical protein
MERAGEDEDGRVTVDRRNKRRQRSAVKEEERGKFDIFDAQRAKKGEIEL